MTAIILMVALAVTAVLVMVWGLTPSTPDYDAFRALSIIEIVGLWALAGWGVRNAWRGESK